MKHFMRLKFSGIILITFFFVFSAQKIKAQCKQTNDFSSAVTIGPAQAAGVWYTDRYAPSGFVSNVNFAGDKRLKESISAADGLTSRPPAYQSPFYNTQGRKYDLDNGTQYMEINLYVPAAWATTGRRMAGFWGTAFDVIGDVSGYPIIEFTSEGGIARFRGWNDVNGWVDMGLPSVFTYNSWVKLQIELLASGEFKYSVGSLQMTTTAYASYGSVRIGNVILQGHNTTTGVNYDIYWDDFYNSCYIPCGNKNDKVIVCHNGKELCISANAVAAHLAHGDNIGRCLPAQNLVSKNSNMDPKAPDSKEQMLKITTQSIMPENVKEEFRVNVYPNPSAGAFRIQVISNSIEPVSVKVMDLSGKVLTVNSSVVKGYIVLGNELKGGTYIAEVIQGTSRQVIKLVKVN